MQLIKRLICFGLLASVAGFSQTAAPKAAPYLRQAAISQSAGLIHIDANSPRPLEQTLDALQQKYGWVVDYEDPRYVSHVDFAEAPDEEHAQIPAGHSFSVEFPATEPDEEKTLRLIVDAYNGSQNPGQFEFRRSPEGDFYVVGMAAHDDKGAIARQPAVFDLPVTLATKERTIAETIDLIFQSITKQSHTKITLGVHPRSTMSHIPVKLGGSKMPARELLRQSLLAAPRKLYWRLLYDPSAKAYFLDVHSFGPPRK